MKKRIWLSVLLSFGFLSQGAPITDAIIDVKASKIKRMISIHQYISTGLSVMGYLQQVQYVVEGIQYFINDEQSQTKIVCACQNSIPNSGDDAGLPTISSALSNLFFTTAGLKHIAKKGGYMLLNLGGLFICLHQFNKVNHPDTLRWYVKSKAPYQKVVVCLKKTADSLHKNDLSDDKVSYYKKQLLVFLRQLIGYGQDVCGYMKYKSDLLDEAAQAEGAKNCLSYLKTYQNRCFKALYELSFCLQDDQSYASFCEQLEDYIKELAHQKDVFAVLEGELEFQEEEF